MSNLFFAQLWAKFFGGVDPSASGDHSSPPPWDPWELDSEFFAAMSQWTIDNPETTLNRVFDAMCTGIENGQPLLELIPDSPFPARSLVKALGYLLTLGRVRDPH
jgi:hypothetical protein